LALLQSLADHPLVTSSDLPRVDADGRQHWLRFRDGFAIKFWIDHAAKEVRVTDVGIE
jgi:hypothetical protein